MRRVMVIAVALGLLFGLALPAGAGNEGKGFKATIDGAETGFLPDFLIPEGRCPDGTGWMLFAGGVGEAEGYGAFMWTTAHCSRPIAPTPDGAVGKLAAGELVMMFGDTGDVLRIAYDGQWKFSGDLMTGDGIAKVHQRYVVMGGTGMFEGATGHGRMNGVDDFHEILMHLRGSLHIDS